MDEICFAVCFDIAILVYCIKLVFCSGLIGFARLQTRWAQDPKKIFERVVRLVVVIRIHSPACRPRCCELSRGANVSIFSRLK